MGGESSRREDRGYTEKDKDSQLQTWAEQVPFYNRRLGHEKLEKIAKTQCSFAKREKNTTMHNYHQLIHRGWCQSMKRSGGWAKGAWHGITTRRQEARNNAIVWHIVYSTISTARTQTASDLRSRDRSKRVRVRERVREGRANVMHHKFRCSLSFA